MSIRFTHNRLFKVSVVLALALAPLAGCVTSVMRAEHNLKVGNYTEARDISKRSLAGDPENRRVLMTFGWSEFKLGNYQSALEAFQKAEVIDQDDYSPKSGIAWSQFKLGKLEAARVKFTKAEASPRDLFEIWDIHDGLGWIAYSRGQLDKAEQYFNFDPYDLEYRFPVGTFGWQKDSLPGRGMVELSRNRLVRARELFVEGAKVYDPDYFRNYDGLARTALLEEKFEEALDHALDAADRTDFNAGLAVLIDAILEKIGSPERTVKVFAEILRDSKNPKGYYPFLGRAQLKAGLLRDAEASFEKTLQFNPDDAWAKDDLARVRRNMNKLVSSGWVRYFNGNYQQALAIFQAKRRLGKMNNNPAAETGRGWALLSLGEMPQAKKAFEEALEIDPFFASAKEGLKAVPDPHEILYSQGWAFAEAGKYQMAKQQFLRAEKYVPKGEKWRTDDSLAWLYWYQKEFRKAETGFRRILAADPKAFLSRKGLAYIALERNNYANAWKHLKASLAQEPKQILTSYTVPALDFLKGRKFQLAAKLLEMGAEIYPKSTDIQFLLAKAYIGLGQTEAAVKAAIGSATLAPAYIHPAFEELSLDKKTVRKAYLAMAEGLYSAGDNPSAIGRVEDYIKAGGKDFQAFRLRGFALFREGRYKEATADLTLATGHEPKELAPVTESILIPGTKKRWIITYNAKSTLAWNFFRQGLTRKAARQFRAVIKDYPHWIDAQTGLGYSLLALGDKKGAIASFRKVLIVSPGYPDAWRGLILVKGAG